MIGMLALVSVLALRGALKTKWLSLGFAGLGVLCTLTGLFLAPVLAARIPQKLESILTLVNQDQKNFVTARGVGSAVDRTHIAKATISGIMEKPFFGWGTQRSVIAGLPYPAGSHNTYLGVAYKFGLAGVSSFLGIFLVLFIVLLLRNLFEKENKFEMGCFFVILIGIVFHQIFEEMNLDGTTLHLFWSTMGFAVATTRQQDA